jgi:hypothetical protein
LAAARSTSIGIIRSQGRYKRSCQDIFETNLWYEDAKAIPIGVPFLGIFINMSTVEVRKADDIELTDLRNTFGSSVCLR